MLKQPKMYVCVDCVYACAQKEGAGANTSSPVSLLWKLSQCASHSVHSPLLCLHNPWLFPFVVVLLICAVFIIPELHEQ